MSVSGKLCPAATNPVPDKAAALTVTGPVPVDERISGCVMEAFTGTLPKASVEVLILRADTAAFNWSA